jgi:hypothetical protein
LQSRAPDPASFPQKRKPAVNDGGLGKENEPKLAQNDSLLLPRALLVAIRFQALSALVLVHL